MNVNQLSGYESLQLNNFSFDDDYIGKISLTSTLAIIRNGREVSNFQID